MMRAIVCGFVVMMSGCSLEHQFRAESDLVAVRDELLSKHKNWRALGDGHDITFRLRGYLTTEMVDKRPSHKDVVAVLGKTIKEINTFSFDKKAWQGLVFMRTYPPDYEVWDGWYGQVLVRKRCVFFGDPVLLKQIDKDLR